MMAGPTDSSAWGSLAPAVPGVDLAPGVHALAVASPVRRARVVPRDPVDALEVDVVRHLDDPALHAHVGVPAGLVEGGQRDPGVAAEVVEALAALVHVDQDPVTVEEVPGRHGHRSAVLGQGGDD